MRIHFIDEYIKKSEENGIPISYNKLRLPQFNLPDARWYVDNCPDENIKSWSDFVNWCGFHTRGVKLPKEKAKNQNILYKLEKMHKLIELGCLEWQNINKQYFYTVSI